VATFSPISTTEELYSVGGFQQEDLQIPSAQGNTDNFPTGMLITKKHFTIQNDAPSHDNTHRGHYNTLYHTTSINN